MPLDFFESIDTQFRKKLPFVAYRKPKEDRVKAVFQNDDRVHHLKTYAETGFIFAPFDARHPTLIIAPDALLEISDLERQVSNTKWDGTVPTSDKQDDLAMSTSDKQDEVTGPTSDKERKESHIHLIEKGISEIKKGTFEKVVLSRCLETDSKARPLDLFQKLLVKHPNAFCYLWYHPKVGLWLGATPEILLMLKNRHLTTMSLAGTQKYAGTENPKWGHKELEEQQLVTDYITDALKDQVDHLSKSNTETIRAGELLHLRTKITGLVDEKNLGSIVSALHPTPAICGMPKESTQDFIVENENYNREFYTGFLGELNLRTDKQRNNRKGNQENQAYRSITKTTTLYVNLRCMQLKANRAHIYVGGGITKDSDPEREWEETVAKSSTMLSILG